MCAPCGRVLQGWDFIVRRFSGDKRYNGYNRVVSFNVAPTIDSISLLTALVLQPASGNKQLSLEIACKSVIYSCNTGVQYD